MTFNEQLFETRIPQRPLPILCYSNNYPFCKDIIKFVQT